MRDILRARPWLPCAHAGAIAGQAEGRSNRPAHLAVVLGKPEFGTARLYAKHTGREDTGTGWGAAREANPDGRRRCSMLLQPQCGQTRTCRSESVAACRL